MGKLPRELTRTDKVPRDCNGTSSVPKVHSVTRTMPRDGNVPGNAPRDRNGTVTVLRVLYVLCSEPSDCYRDCGYQR